MNKKDVLVVGELNIDLILNDIQGFPSIGREILAEKMNMTLGSSSAIFASNISVLGAKTAFCGMVGKDIFGDFVLKALKEKKVDDSFVHQSASLKTGITLVMNYDQNRANVTYCGAMEALTMDHIPWNILQQFRHFHLSSYFLQKGLQKDIVAIFKKAREAGLSTSLDLQSDPENRYDFNYEACLPYVDIFFPNESELLALTKSGDITQGLNRTGRYGHIIALKLGDKGSVAYSDGVVVHADPYRHNQFADAIGAGDSFNAGFIHQYLSGGDVESCLRLANLMGGLNTTAPGGTGAFTSKEEVSQQVQSIFKTSIFTHAIKG